MDNRLHTNLSFVTRIVLKFVFIAFCVAVLVDIDHIIDGHRGCLHEPLVLLVAWIIFVGITFISGLFYRKVLR